MKECGYIAGLQIMLKLPQRRPVSLLARLLIPIVFPPAHRMSIRILNVCSE